MGKLFKAVAFVTIFSVLTRALGFLLRVYLSRVLGAELLGTYQVAMSVFGVLLTLVASGLPTVISRYVSFLSNNGDRRGATKMVSAGLVVALVTSISVSVIILLCPKLLNLIFTSSSSTKVLLLLLPGIISSSVYTILRGAMWGQKHFFTISFAEFFEQLVRLIILALLITLPLNMGLEERAGLSLSLACIVSAAFVVVCYFAFGGKLSNPKGGFKTLLKTSTPITAVRTASGLVTSIISIIIPARLMLYGYTAGEALAQFGILMGMTFPMLMIPGTLISSLAVAIIPSLSEQTTNIDKEVKDFGALKAQINMAIGLSIVISIILLPAYFCMGTDLGEFLFSNRTAGYFLSATCLIMIPLGLNQITSCVLNAVGLEMKSLKNYVAGAVLLFICIYFLPKYIGVWALVLGMTLLSLTTSVLNLVMLKKRDLLSVTVIKVLFVCLGLCAPATLLSKLCYNLLKAFLPRFLALMFGGALSVVFIGTLLLLTNTANIRTFVFKRKKSAARPLAPKSKFVTTDNKIC